MKQRYPNGIIITNTYDSLNRLTSTTSKKPDGTTVITGEYKYDAAGNVRYILQETAENKHLLLVSYDDYNRMVKEEKKVDGDMYTAQSEWDHSYDDADNYNGWSEYVVIPGPGARFATGGRSHTQMNSLNQVGKTTYFPGDSMERRYGYDEMGNMAQIISFYYNAPEGHQEHIINYTFDGFGRMIKIENEERIIEYEYDYRGRLMRRVERELPDGENVETARMSYSGGTSVLEKNVENTLRFYRGLDMGGGVGGLLYAENADSSGLNYKHYNLRGDIVATTDSGGSILSELRYLGNGDIKGSSGTQPADKFKHNTKRVEDGFVNEGRRYRDIEMMRFTSPDPLEYIDGLNCYIYCGNNPWGRFDPYGLADTYLADGAGAAYASYDNYNNEFIVATMMKFYIKNIKNIEAGKKYIFVREVNINVNSEKQRIVLANDFVGTKNTELDLRVFLSDIHNNYVLNSDTDDENTIVANVRFAIIEGSADKLGMPKSNVSVVDMNQSGGPIGDVKKYKSTQKGKLAFYAEDSGKLTSYAAENMTLDDIIKGHNVQDSGSFSYKNKIRITDKSFGTGENEVSGSGILGELIKIPKNTYYEINKIRNNIYKNNITGKQ